MFLTKIKLVEMKPEYAKKLREIWLSPGVIEYTLQSEERTVKEVLKKLINDESKTLVALISNEPAGCAKIHFMKGRRNHTAELVIFIDPNYHSMGIGTKLMDAVIKIIKKKKLKRLELEINVDNKKAIGLYKKFGLKKEGRKIKASQRGNKLVDNFVMARIF